MARRLRFLARDAAVEEREGHILKRVLVADEVERLEHESYHVVAQVGGLVLGEILDQHSVEVILARVVVVEDAEYVEQSRFARAGRTHYRHQLALVNLEVDILEHMQGHHAGI